MDAEFIPPSLCLRCQAPVQTVQHYCAACRPFAPAAYKGHAVTTPPQRICRSCGTRRASSPAGLCAVCDGPSRRGHGRW
jgi:hypothetical protein